MNDKAKDILAFLEKYKAISVNQCMWMFFQDGDPSYRHDRSQKKLRQMENYELIKSYTNALNGQKIYYVDNKLSAHDLYVNDFFAKLAEMGCTDMRMETQPRFLKGMIRPDALIRVAFQGYVYFLLLEVDLTHFTGMSKMQEYERLFQTGEVQAKCYGKSPTIVIVGVNTLQYQSKNLDVVYLPFDMNGIEKLFLK